MYFCTSGKSQKWLFTQWAHQGRNCRKGETSSSASPSCFPSSAALSLPWHHSYEGCAHPQDALEKLESLWWATHLVPSTRWNETVCWFLVFATLLSSRKRLGELLKNAWTVFTIGSICLKEANIQKRYRKGYIFEVSYQQIIVFSFAFDL